MRPFLLVLTVALSLPAGPAARQSSYRTLNDTFDPPTYASVDEWKRRAAWLREHIYATAGLLPAPERTPLAPVIFDEIKRADYAVAKVYFESLPGFFVTGNLYRPIGAGPFPAILSPHGHWPYGRLENSDVASVPGRAINLARQGFVVFTYDMVGYNDSRQLPHRTFGGRREKLWGLTVSGLQLWNGIRALDFLETLPYVRKDALGVTGASGGGTQTFMLAAADDRVAVAAPVNMISLHMQGGCVCENQPGLRLDTTNVELAGLIAPRPLLMVSATGDWTKNTMEIEYPAVKRIYALSGAGDRVHGVRFEADHNYNRDSREAMYAWMARWLQNAPAGERRPERDFTPEQLQDLLVFHGRALPAAALTSAQLTESWIRAAERQRASVPPETLQRALLHTLHIEGAVPATRASASRTVLLADTDPDVERALKAAGMTVRSIAFTEVDETAAAKISEFEGYNRTTAGRRVDAIVSAARTAPGATLVASGDAALAGLLAAAVAPIGRAILDVGSFDTASDEDFLARLYIPGLRRAGDLQTAAGMATGEIVVHNAGERFLVKGQQPQHARLSAQEIVGRIRGGARKSD
jgi:hypothetical protein